METEAPRNDPNHRKKTEKYPLHLICNLENLKLKKGLHILHITTKNGMSKRQLIIIE